MADHTHNAGCTGIENPDIHDGILWWICSDGTARPRFAPGCPHHQPGATHANAYNRGRNDERGQRTAIDITREAAAIAQTCAATITEVTQALHRVTQAASEAQAAQQGPTHTNTQPNAARPAKRHTQK